MILANGLVSFGFDPDTGSLVQITDQRAGREYLSDPQEGRLFRLFAPDDENWIDRYAESHTAGTPRISLAGETLTICYPDVRMADGNPSGIQVVVRVSLPAGEDEALFTMEINHAGPHRICEVIFPWVGGWHGYSGESGVIQCGTHAPFNPFTGLRRNDGWNILNSTRRTSIGFPHVNIPMCDITNDKVGLSYNYYPNACDLNFDLFVMDLNDEMGDTHPSFGWVHRPYLVAGQSWMSGPVGIAPHEGDWHFAADKMRKWLSSWWKAPPQRSSLSGAIGFHNAYFRDFSGLELRPLSKMPEIARYGLEHGLDHFLMWDMSLLGMYLRAGSGNLFEDRPERHAELRDAVREVRQMGVNVGPLINLRLGMQAHPFWKEKGERWAIRSYYGLPAQETLPLRRNTAPLINRYLDQGGVRFCQNHPQFQSWALENTRKVLDLGFNTIFIDQPFSEDYCFSDQHGHPVPVAGHSGTCNWIPRAAEIVHRHSPDSYVIGEVPDIWNTQFFDLWWFWDWTWLRPEVFRYILPHSLQSWVIDVVDHQDQVGRAFTEGFLLNINVRSLEKTLLDAPEFADRVAQLAALRRKTYSFTSAGRFLDRCGLTLDTDALITASVYQVDGKTGIVLGEGSLKPNGGGRMKLTLEPEALGISPGSEIILHAHDGSARTLRPVRIADTLVLETRLDRWECAVLEL